MFNLFVEFIEIPFRKMKKNGKERSVGAVFKRLAHLYIENARLVVIERLAVLCSALTLVVLASVVGGFALLFVSLGCVKCLSQIMPEHWAYITIGGGYVLLLTVLLLMRRVLVVNPVTRFLSRLMWRDCALDELRYRLVVTRVCIDLEKERMAGGLMSPMDMLLGHGRSGMRRLLSALSVADYAVIVIKLVKKLRNSLKN